jgi:hypothetical protein
MYRWRIDMTRTATLFAIVASASLSAQTPPAAQTPPITVTGCVAEAQRDGSLGTKATGPQATPETATNEANNPTPTNRYQLMDATSAAGTAGTADAKPVKTTYALRGHEQELAKHLGHRVEVAGSLAPSLAAKLPAKEAAAAEGVRTVQVSSLKMIGTDCSPAKDK